MSNLENTVQVEQTMEDTWTSPADHFRPRNKFMTLYTDRNYLVMKYTAWKSRFLGSALVPSWTPMYFIMTHFEQRVRNLYLVENQLNYRPYKFRPNTETSKY